MTLNLVFPLRLYILHFDIPHLFNNVVKIIELEKYYKRSLVF